MRGIGKALYEDFKFLGVLPFISWKQQCYTVFPKFFTVLFQQQVSFEKFDIEKG